MIFESGHALVVGVSKYHHHSEMDVPIVSEDALEVVAVLSDPRYCAYPKDQITALCGAQATQKNIEAALDKIAAKLTPDDTFLLFYSGHGEYGEDGYYFTTRDTKISAGKVVSEGGGIHEKTMLEKVQAIQANRKFLIFNACYAGEISPDSLGKSPQPERYNLPNRLTAALLATGQGLAIITACREKQRSYFLKKSELTIFAQAFSDGLRGRGVDSRKGYISIFDLYEYVFSAVSSEVEKKFGFLGCAQEPELTIQKGVGAMAIALHRGKQPEGELDNKDRPSSLSGTVAEVEATDAQRSLQKIMNGEFSQPPSITTINQDKIDLRGSQGAILNPTGAVTQNFGNTTNIDTKGGDYVGRDSYKR